MRRRSKHEEDQTLTGNEADAFGVGQAGRPENGEEPGQPQSGWPHQRRVEAEAGGSGEARGEDAMTVINGVAKDDGVEGPPN